MNAAEQIQKLTPRQREVLKAIADDADYKQLEKVLGVKSGSVAHHRLRLKRALGMPYCGTAMLTRVAVRGGLIEA